MRQAKEKHKSMPMPAHCRSSWQGRNRSNHRLVDTTNLVINLHTRRQFGVGLLAFNPQSWEQPVTTGSAPGTIPDSENPGQKSTTSPIKGAAPGLGWARHR